MAELWSKQFNSSTPTYTHYTSSFTTKIPIYSSNIGLYQNPIQEGILTYSLNPHNWNTYEIKSLGPLKLLKIDENARHPLKRICGSMEIKMWCGCLFRGICGEPLRQENDIGLIGWCMYVSSSVPLITALLFHEREWVHDNSRGISCIKLRFRKIPTVSSNEVFRIGYFMNSLTIFKLSMYWQNNSTV